ncbi:NAD(P)-dependent alcohol dehydrogenase [Phytomonospora endophytica]|uniref:Propanol-preferring alcohol dehydrogenase n=1 Tax=Phytomonospora endophytica TaxID=714109 RepID=A0A841FPT2_9ACTN|nr:NAD(P)-dependent alcohol dehydrogenase [Phytomonospora endophytica]MBB6038125.1 propanol-preferring alcohol dehydrogenase [Phytomonospora endophytica]GIG67412.1 oxidoreductase [Phytomonospora endophytica]
MKAFQLQSPGVAELTDVDVPEPGPGEVLLKVSGAGVCHSDLHILHADAWAPLPMTIGHEVCGHVASTGTGVTGWDDGDGALAYLCWGCGKCRTCASGYENYCEAFGRGIVPGPGLGYQGAMAEYLIVPARFLVPLGDLDPVDSAPLTDAGLTPYHAVNMAREALVAKANAVVIGVGGLGHMGVQILAATTGSRIIAVDLDEAKLAHATELGAAETVKSDEHAAARILDLTGGRGAEVVFDFVGAQPTLELAASVIAPHGRIVLVGLAEGSLDFRAGSPPAALPWGAGIVKPYGGTRADLHDVIALASRGAISVTVERHPLSEVKTAFDRLQLGQVAGRAVLVP